MSCSLVLPETYRKPADASRMIPVLSVWRLTDESDWPAGGLDFLRFFCIRFRAESGCIYTKNRGYYLDFKRKYLSKLRK